MRPASVSDEEILAAGQRLRDARIRINGFTLRREVGNTGTPSRLFAVWQRLNGEGTGGQAEQPHELPLEIEEMLESLNTALLKKTREMAGNIAQHAMRLADRRIAEICHQHDAERAAHEEVLEDANKSIEDAEQRVEAIQEELLKAHERAEKLQQERDKAQREAAAAQQQATERERELRHQEQRMAALEARLESSTIALATSRADESQARAQLDECKARLKTAQHDLSTCRAQEAQAQTLLTEQKAQITENKERILHLQREHHAISIEANAQRVDLAAQQELNRSLKSDLQRADQASEQLRQDLGRQTALHEQTRGDLEKQIQVLAQQLEHSNRLLEKMDAKPKTKAGRSDAKKD